MFNDDDDNEVFSGVNLSKSLFVRGAAVHERLSYDWQTRVDDVRLVNIK